MLPLLPALILLLLQGPAGIERMAWHGQLPGAIDAVHRQMMRSPDQTCVADDVVLASLIAVSGNQGMARALLQVFAFIRPEEIEVRPQIVGDEGSSPPIRIPSSIGRTRDGYFTCRRSRDGPTLIA